MCQLFVASNILKCSLCSSSLKLLDLRQYNARYHLISITIISKKKKKKKKEKEEEEEKKKKEEEKKKRK